jgi:glycosyltransferase involved in cell wall biosynthesis
VRICLVVSEFFHWGQFGGYGTIARSLAEGLSQRGHELFALVPKRTPEATAHQRDIERVGSVTVIAIPHSYRQRIWRRSLYAFPQAELYLNVDPRFDSWMAMAMNPRARHCIWFVDPMDFATFWNYHYRDPNVATRLDKYRTGIAFWTLQRFGRVAVQRADALLSQTRYHVEFAPAFYGVRRTVAFAPNPIPLPAEPVVKSPTPLVLFLGRFDWQKQPERFFQLAARFPAIKFVAAGTASDPKAHALLVERCVGIPNLTLPGVVTGDAKESLLRQGWILCNTSRREGLPVSFQEALAHRCALLSSVDPDGLTSRFGRHVTDGDFEAGLQALLEHDRWRDLGRAGFSYISQSYERERALDVHESIYNQLVTAELIPCTASNPPAS